MDVISYQYDSVGNRVSRDSLAQEHTLYKYNANDQLLSESTGASTTHYGYDNNGNLLFKNQDGLLSAS